MKLAIRDSEILLFEDNTLEDIAICIYRFDDGELIIWINEVASTKTGLPPLFVYYFLLSIKKELPQSISLFLIFIFYDASFKLCPISDEVQRTFYQNPCSMLMFLSLRIEIFILLCNISKNMLQEHSNRARNPVGNPTQMAGIGLEYEREVVLGTSDRKRCACSICGSKERMELDHVVPKSRGGVGLRLICWHCNRIKSDRRMDDRCLQRWVKYRHAKATDRLFEERWV